MAESRVMQIFYRKKLLRCTRPRASLILQALGLSFFVLVAVYLLRGQPDRTIHSPRHFMNYFGPRISSSAVFDEETFPQRAETNSVDVHKATGLLTSTANLKNARASARSKDAILQEQNRRRQILEEGCRRLNMSRDPPRGYSHMLVSDAHKILFTFIPKVSCKSWKDVFEQLRRHNNGSGSPKFTRYSADEKKAKLASYRKVLFVREPLSRVLSAYMSKFRGGALYHHAPLQRFWERTYGRDIVQRYRGLQATSIPKRTWLNITLPEFLQYITDLGTSIKMNVYNDHWLPQNIISHACQIQYDFIGHFENLETEGPYVLKWLEVDHLVGLPEYHDSNALQKLVDYYRQVPLDLIRKVTEYYKNDYMLFGYSVDDIIARFMQRLFKDHNV